MALTPRLSLRPPLRYFPRSIRRSNIRSFTTTSPNQSAFFQLGALSNSRETNYFNKYSGLSRVEHSPNLALIRSSEVKPMETKKSPPVPSRAGKKLQPITKIVAKAAAAPPTTVPAAKYIVRNVGRHGKMYGMRLVTTDKSESSTQDTQKRGLDHTNSTVTNETSAMAEAASALESLRSLRPSTSNKKQTESPLEKFWRRRLENIQTTLRNIESTPESLKHPQLKSENDIDATRTVQAPKEATTPAISTSTKTTTTPEVASTPRLSTQSLKALSLGRIVLQNHKRTRNRLRNQLRQRISRHRADKRAFVEMHYRLLRANLTAYLAAIAAVTLGAGAMVMAWTAPQWFAEKKQIWDLGGKRTTEMAREGLNGFLELGGIWGVRGSPAKTVSAGKSNAVEAVVDSTGKAVLVQSKPAPLRDEVVRGPAKVTEPAPPKASGNEGWSISLHNLFWNGPR